MRLASPSSRDAACGPSIASQRREHGLPRREFCRPQFGTAVRIVSCVGMTIGLVERLHLEGWAGWPDAHLTLPELMRRLVIEITEGVADADFASGKGVFLAGFDGRVQGAPSGSMWVPEGSSVWEVSTPGEACGQGHQGLQQAPRCASRLGQVGDELYGGVVAGVV